MKLSPDVVQLLSLCSFIYYVRKIYLPHVEILFALQQKRKDVSTTYPKRLFFDYLSGNVHRHSHGCRRCVHHRHAHDCDGCIAHWDCSPNGLQSMLLQLRRNFLDSLRIALYPVVPMLLERLRLCHRI